MLAYLDTSAFVPLLVAEGSTPACRALWDAADEVASTRLLFVENAAALAQAHRAGRLERDQLEAALGLLDDYWADIQVIDVDQGLVRRAAVLAREFGLRGYDAVHCAVAALLDDPELVAATGDRLLLSAWGDLGLSVYDPNLPGAAHPERSET